MYTVEVDNPKTDCVLVSRDRVLGTGTRGTYVSHVCEEFYSSTVFSDAIGILWDAYQTETIRKFYGNEPKAKKALVTYQTNPGHIIVPGLAGISADISTMLLLSDLCRRAWTPHRPWIQSAVTIRFCHEQRR